MTAFIPTTRVSVWRWSSADADGDGAPDGMDKWGDPTDSSATSDAPEGSNQLVRASVPAAVAEDLQRSYQASSGREGVVEYYTVRLRPGTDVREGDRLIDRDGVRVYQVQSVSASPGLIGLADVRTTCTRVAATSSP